MERSESLSIIDKLAQKDKDQRAGLFISPVAPGGSVRLKVAGIADNFEIAPKNFEGWGVFSIVGSRKAKFHSKPSLIQIKQYSELMPAASFVMLEGGIGLQISTGSGGLKVEGAVKINLVERANLFDSVRAIFDGTNFWYVGRDKRSPAFGQMLRENLSNLVSPDKVSYKGLLKPEKAAYEAIYESRVPEDGAWGASAARLTDKERAALALDQAGVKLKNYSLQAGNRAKVSFVQAGRQHNVIVDNILFESDKLWNMSFGA